ncbi:UNVERIFIED_CONTAM: hypothetical protein Sradi_1903500 [Sesamum radiatum]|uniref:Uncharacterized protein n=1 Tax=Sesamum radiatum TaxID=300843 RepID=A0AAW2U211_SESRA
MAVPVLGRARRDGAHGRGGGRGRGTGSGEGGGEAALQTEDEGVARRGGRRGGGGEGVEKPAGRRRWCVGAGRWGGCGWWRRR